MKSIKKNYVYNLIYQIFTMIVPLITTPYLARVLGADGIGTASFIDSVSLYFVLFASMGISTYGQRETSYVQDNREKRTILFWEIIGIEFVTSFISIVVYVVFSLRQLHSSLYLVLVFNILAVIVNITWFFQGLEEFGKIVLRNIIFRIINIIYIFTIVKSKDDLIWYMFGTSFFVFVSNASLWFYLPRYIGKPLWKSLRPLRHVKSVILLFIPAIAIQIYTVLDKTMIGLITGSAFENGYYEQATKISKMVLTVVTSLGTVMIPRVGFYYEKGDIEKVKALMYKGYRFVWFAGVPLCLGLAAISENFVGWFYGEGYDEVIPLLHILSFLIIAIGISNITGMQYLIPTKREKAFTLTVIVGAVTNFALNLILIPKFQSIGAAVASVVAETVIAVVQIWTVRNELNPLAIVKEGIHYYIAGVIMAVATYFIGRNLASSIVNTLFIVICGAVVYGLCLVIMRDEYLCGIIKLERI